MNRKYKLTNSLNFFKLKSKTNQKSKLGLHSTECSQIHAQDKLSLNVKRIKILFLQLSNASFFKQIANKFKITI